MKGGNNIMKKNIIVPVMLLAVITIAVFGAQLASAYDTSESGPSIVQKIADRFNLNKDDVQKVFDEDRKEHMAKMEEKYLSQLDQYVKDDKITEAQKQLIINKRKELQSKREGEFSEMKNKTPDERRTIMENHRKEIDEWAKQNGIDPKYLMIGFKMKIHGGPGMRDRVSFEKPLNASPSVTSVPTQ